MDRYSRFLWQSSEKLGRFGTLESTARRASHLFSNDERLLKTRFAERTNQLNGGTRNEESASFIRTMIYLEK